MVSSEISGKCVFTSAACSLHSKVKHERYSVDVEVSQCHREGRGLRGSTLLMIELIYLNSGYPGNGVKKKKKHLHTKTKQ